MYCSKACSAAGGKSKNLVFCDESKCVYRECALELDAPQGKIKRCSIGSARRRRDFGYFWPFSGAARSTGGIGTFTSNWP